jgi:glutaredoxin-related protein
MKHNKLAIFEGTMCCESGVCGVEPDKVLVEFNETLKKIQKDYPQVQVQRANMSHGLDIYRQNLDILKMIKEKGVGILPLVIIDGSIVFRQQYPKYDELKKALEA